MTQKYAEILDFSHVSELLNLSNFQKWRGKCFSA